MSKFYAGQPVVCIWSREKWLTGWLGPVDVRLPTQGHKYVVDVYDQSYTFLKLCGLSNADLVPGELWFSENGFAPVSENQVKALIDTALDVPSNAPPARVTEPETNGA